MSAISDSQAVLTAPKGRFLAGARGLPATRFVAVLTFALGSAYLLLLSSLPPDLHGHNDFYREAWPAYRLLDQGRFVAFIQAGPAYVGSLVIRAPFALIASALGGHQQALYFATGLPCVAALAVFCAWLSARPRRGGEINRASRLTPVLLLFVSPVFVGSLILGHPEEILGGVLCVAAVLLAVNGRAEAAGLVIGLAVANKSSALVAVPVVLAVVPRERWRALVLMAVTAGAFVLPLTIIRDYSGSISHAGAALGTVTTGQFYAPQLLWWLGSNSWIVREAHPLLVLVAVACVAVWSLQRSRNGLRSDPVSDALLLLTLVLLVRDALDPWNNIYYELPFLMALMTYEICLGRRPILTFIYSVLLGVAFFPWTADVRAALYAALTAPTIAWLIVELYRPTRSERLAKPISSPREAI